MARGVVDRTHVRKIRPDGDAALLGPPLDLSQHEYRFGFDPFPVALGVTVHHLERDRLKLPFTRIRPSGSLVMRTGGCCSPAAGRRSFSRSGWDGMISIMSLTGSTMACRASRCSLGGQRETCESATPCRLCGNRRADRPGGQRDP